MTSSERSAETAALPALLRAQAGAAHMTNIRWALAVLASPGGDHA
jgi:hypothetical protein